MLKVVPVLRSQSRGQQAEREEGTPIVQNDAPVLFHLDLAARIGRPFCQRNLLRGQANAVRTQKLHRQLSDTDLC